jgi:hypothetical protein
VNVDAASSSRRIALAIGATAIVGYLMLVKLQTFSIGSQFGRRDGSAEPDDENEMIA